MTHQANALSVAEALSAAEETKRLELGPGAVQKTADVFLEHFGDRVARLVADTNTFAIAGERVVQALREARVPFAEPFVYSDPDLYAEDGFVVRLEQALTGRGVIPIAVGAGTINDLTKLAAHRTGRSYMVVATAASMDGYTAFGSSITYKGSKQTFACPAPRAVIADLDFMRAAPPEMNAAGYADLLAKTVAGADWLLADALEVEPINRKAWDIVQGGLRKAVGSPEEIPRRGIEAVRNLAEGLLLAGFAMQCARSSRPASGAEHQFSHLWDMEHHTHHGCAPAHGLKVGIGTLASTALYEYLISQDLGQLDIEHCCARWPCEADLEKLAKNTFAQPELAAVALQETRAKWLEPDRLRVQLQKLRDVWPTLRERLRAQLIPTPELKHMLRAAGAVAEPEEIGISRARLRESFKRAHSIRRRFTVLDVAVRCELLEPALAHLFGPNGPWPLPCSE